MKHFLNVQVPDIDPISKAEIERRRSVRVSARIPVKIVEESSNKKISGVALRISVGGCYVEAVDTFPVGTKVKISLQLEARTFRCEAKVVSSVMPLGMGLAFAQHELLDLMVQMDKHFPV